MNRTMLHIGLVDVEAQRFVVVTGQEVKEVAET